MNKAKILAVDILVLKYNLYAMLVGSLNVRVILNGLEKIFWYILILCYD